ncbi:MAG TPA: tetratricopeptide repeat protein, partial [Phnomibacter sp.]|nr:tetratricopeptide repeat protein [Phnomibacter sp.]
MFALNLYDAAVRALDEAIVTFPEDIRTYKKVIEIEKERNRSLNAFLAAESWCRYAPADPEALLQAGWYGMLSGNIGRSGHYLYRALQLWPYNEKVYRYLTYFHGLRGNDIKITEYLIRSIIFSGTTPGMDKIMGKELHALTRSISFPYDTTYMLDLTRKLAMQYRTLPASVVLDSIKMPRYAGYANHDKDLNALKHKFIDLESRVTSDKRRRSLIAQCYMDLAQFEYESGSKENFAAYLTKGINEFIEYNDFEMLGYNYLNILQKLGPEQPLVIMYRTALAAGERIQDKNIIYRSYSALSACFVKFGQYDSALTYLNAAFHLVGHSADEELYTYMNGKKELIRKLAGDLNLVHRSKQQLDSALYYAEMVRKNDERPDHFRHRSLEGITYQACGEYNKAIAVYQQLLKDSNSLIKENAYASLNANIGRCYLKLKNFTQAASWLNRALGLQKATDNSHGTLNENDPTRTNILDDLIDLYTRTNDPDGLFRVGEEGRCGLLYFPFTGTRYPMEVVSLPQVQKTLQNKEACIQYFGIKEQ